MKTSTLSVTSRNDETVQARHELTSTSLREMARSIGFLLFLFPLIPAGLGQDVKNLDLARTLATEEVVRPISALHQRALAGNAQAQYSLGTAYVAGTEVAL